MSNENETEKPNNQPAPSPEASAPSGESTPAADDDKAAKIAAAKAAAAAKKAAEPKEAAAPPPPPEPGKYGQLLSANGHVSTALGKAANGTEMISLEPKALVEAARFLKENDGARFDLLVSLAGVDWKEYREVVYHLYSTYTFEALVLKVKAEGEKVPSVVSIWQTADWHERETYDLFGITFEGHPNLQRILMPSDWIGHPLRKDYTVNDPRLVWNER